VLVAFVILILFLAKGVYDIYGREQESAKLRSDAEQKMRDLEAQKANLSGEVEKLGSEAGVEEKIRSKFNVAKPGENVVLIVDDATTTATSTPGFFASLWAKIWR
jgi:cell division protein FtsB